MLKSGFRRLSINLRRLRPLASLSSSARPPHLLPSLHPRYMLIPRLDLNSIPCHRLRFLNHAAQRKKNHNLRKRASFSRKEIVIEKSTVDDLPPGWIKEVKIKRTAYGVRKYVCYTDPARGYVFLSKKTVHRYLETGELAEGVFLPKKCNDDQFLTSTDESVVIETTTDDDLPSGWIKEVENKRSANGVRTYVYYTDPASGHVFRLKKAVHRYLKTGEIAKGLFLLEKNNDDQILTNADESVYTLYA